LIDRPTDRPIDRPTEQPLPPTVSLINDIQKIGNPMDAVWMVVAYVGDHPPTAQQPHHPIHSHPPSIADLRSTARYIINSISDIFWGSIWVLPTMMLIWAETRLGDMVEETDNLCITRMMEVSRKPVGFVAIGINTNTTR